MLVSVITPTYNAGKTILQNIESVRAQSWPFIEHILIDGKSTDDTLSVAAQYKDHFSKIISAEDGGIYDAMNKGIALASGKLVGILNADDQYLPDSVENAVREYLSQDKEKAIVYGDMIKWFSSFKTKQKGDMSDKAFKKARIKINHPTCFVPLSVYDEIGSFDLNFSSGADREFMYRARYHGVVFVKSKHVLAHFALGGFTSQYSIKKVFKVTREEYALNVRYFNKVVAAKNSMKVFYRGARNLLVSKAIPSNMFCSIRAWRLSKKRSSV